MSTQARTRNTGLVGPVSFCAGALLLASAPWMRGGNRPAALAWLETIAFITLAAMCFEGIAPRRDLDDTLPDAQHARPRGPGMLEWLLLASPLVIALVQLVPLPREAWLALPGRAFYAEPLRALGVALPAWLPASLVPRATLDSLLAAAPLAACFLLGRHARIEQLRMLAALLAAICAMQFLLCIAQLAMGPQSALYFDLDNSDRQRPVGSFANANHLANYVATAFALYVWLAASSLVNGRAHHTSSAFAARHPLLLWLAGGLLFFSTVLLARSRGAALTGLPAGLAAIALAAWAMRRRHDWRLLAALVAVLLAGTLALVGFDAVLARFSADEVSSSFAFRGLLARTTLDGAREFWPLGAGWGTYAAVYPRFQPPQIAGFANYAHQDYAQMLFEGGAIAVALAAGFAWLLVERAVLLARGVAQRGFARDTLASALCAVGLLGFLAHALVEFVMHIPANAMLAALLAGVALRPLSR